MRFTPSTPVRSMARLLALLLSLALIAAACGSGDAETATESTETAETTESSEVSSDDVTLTLITYDSFLVAEDIFDSFTTETGVEVEVFKAGDAGEIVSRAVLTAGDPEGDVLFGIDTSFLQRGLDADIFEPHVSENLSTVPDELLYDPESRVTPMQFGDVCVNYWTDALPGDPPATLEDLRDPQNAASFVTQNPETSSPGFSFLLATIATYGDDWEDYWQDLADGGVTISAGWSEAYYDEFAAGGGENSIVTSYATSPVAEVLFADPPIDAAPTGVLLDSCFRSVEFAGILAGTDYPTEAGLLIDFMLSETFQADIPLNMFVAPANGDVELPPEFIEHGVVVNDPLELTPEEIEANRAAWTERWTEIVLG